MIGMRRISRDLEGGIVFRPAGADRRGAVDPRLAAWAAFFGRFAARFLGALRGIFNLGLPAPKQATASCLFEHIRARVVGRACCRGVRLVGAGLRDCRCPRQFRASLVLRMAGLWLEPLRGVA